MPVKPSLIEGVQRVEVQIKGVRVVSLKQFEDARGKVMHMVRADDPDFERFGEIYFSTVHPGAIKGWHRHQVKTNNYAVIHGSITLVLYDSRSQSPTHGRMDELHLGPDNYCRVTVPPLVWYGFQGMGAETAIVANCATLPHDPQEAEKMDPFHGPVDYSWHCNR